MLKGFASFRNNYIVELQINDVEQISPINEGEFRNSFFNNNLDYPH